MEWLRRGVTSDQSSGQKGPASGKPGSKAGMSQLEKLSGYKDLTKDALQRALTREREGDREGAAKLYQTCVNVATEGLSLDLPMSGLGREHSTTNKWRQQMSEDQQQALARLRDLRSPVPSTSKSVPNLSPTPVLGMPTLWRTQTQPARGISTQPNSVLRPQPVIPPPKRALSKDEAKVREAILSEVLDTRPSVGWDEVVGLSSAKQALKEMVILPTVRADLFQGLRAPARGLLLYGPPGNGKTLLAKALAHEAQATFFNISASSLTSKWHGEAEKLVRALFAVAAEMQPSIIFIDEIDSILSERSAGEHEASRRLKTQFLVEFDGVARGTERIVVIGATNRPQELDDAVRRRMVKRIYIGMPDSQGRKALLSSMLSGQPAKLSRADLERVVASTEGYSGSDLAALCREAAMAPIRDLGDRVSTVDVDKVRKINLNDMEDALSVIRPSVNRSQLSAYTSWTREFGST
ncbi:hypothetical protein WJX73_000052 [Symbiochloris irregularis]|uniref:microtubule-severing ATPase n=1 Tax=Symbiochloris irregularis TaxID=706552 RepID=A0AAW1NNK0_9CHLO